MLKSCWNCIGGYALVRDRLADEDRYGTQMNGDTFRAPLWPVENNNMFLLPRKLSPLDTITIAGVIQPDPRIVTASLLTANNDNLPDYKNIACQIEINFPGDSENQDKMVVKIIKHGQTEIVENDDEDISTSQYISDSNLKLTFMPRSNNGMLEMFVSDNYLQVIKLKHDMSNIRFIDITGDIEKVNTLDFKFA